MGTTGNVTAVFLQARIDSTRLPGKALLKLRDKTVIEHAMERLGKIGAAYNVLLTDKESFPVLRPYAEKWGFSVFAGPRDDVLARYALALKKYPAHTVIRATGDNPLVSWDLAEKILKYHLKHGGDYSGFLKIPLGMGVEAVRSRALLYAHEHAGDPYEREHVCPFLYRRPEQFLCLRPEITGPLRLPDARITLDTSEDYTFLKHLFRDLYRGQPPGDLDVAAWLKNHSVKPSFSQLAV